MPPAHAVRRRAEPASVPSFAAASPLPAEALAELRGDTGFAAWQVLRTVSLWAGEDEDRRAALFDPAYLAGWERRLLESALEAEVRFPLAVIVREMSLAQPGAGKLPWACICAADWALGVGARHAALGFAEAAALAAPRSPRYAWLAGRMMRAHGEQRTAERWLQRALHLAAAQGDHETRARALSSLGTLHLELGRLAEARALHTRALGVSRRWQLHELQGMALHDLFAIATREGDGAEAERLARAALDCCAGSPRQLAKLAQALACWWMEQGLHGRALKLFQALRPHFPRPEDQLRLMGHLGRAAGGAGDRTAFDDAARELERLRVRLGSGEGAPTALLELGRGALELGHWQRAEALAADAGELARLRGDAVVLTRAAALRDQAARAERPPAPAEALSLPTPGSERLAAAVLGALLRPAIAEPVR